MNGRITVGVCGVGNFGFAVIKHLANSKLDQINLRAYDYDKKIIDYIKENQTHPFLFSNVRIPKNVTFCDNPREAFTSCDIVILAVSSHATRIAIRSLKPFFKDGVILLNTAKALDFETGKRLSEVISEELKGQKYTYALMAGGTIARDLFKHEPLGVDVASKNESELKNIKALLSSANLTVYPTTDLIGVEYASAFKNVISVIAGIVKGLGLSYGSETHIISKTASEIAEVCISKFGAQDRTFSIGSQCWGNDLWMSATGNTRNREFGVLIGEGVPVEEAVKIMEANHKTVESIQTISSLEFYPQLLSVPILNELYELVHLKKTTIDNFRSLITSGIA